MKSFFTAILLLSLLLCSFVSCNPKPTAIESATFDSLTIDTIKPLFRSCTKPACHLYLRMDVPVSPTPETTAQAIERFVSLIPKEGAFEQSSDGTVQSMAHAYVRSYLMDYLRNGPEAIDNYGGDTLAAANWMSYEESVEGRAIFNARGLLSYQIRTESYTGGAHGNTNIDNAVLDMTTMSRVSLGDIFTDGTLREVNELMRQTLVREYGCQTLDELADKGLFFAPAEIEATENFYVDGEGITWNFDPYDIAPYSMGEVQISLPWSQLSSLVLLDSPVYKLVSGTTNN